MPGAAEPAVDPELAEDPALPEDAELLLPPLELPVWNAAAAGALDSVPLSAPPEVLT